MADNDKRGIFHNNEANNEGVIIDERSGVAVHESMVNDVSKDIAAAEAADGDETKLGGVEAVTPASRARTGRKA